MADLERAEGQGPEPRRFICAYDEEGGLLGALSARMSNPESLPFFRPTRAVTMRQILRENEEEDEREVASLARAIVGGEVSGDPRAAVESWMKEAFEPCLVIGDPFTTKPILDPNLDRRHRGEVIGALVDHVADQVGSAWRSAVFMFIPVGEDEFGPGFSRHLAARAQWCANCVIGGLGGLTDFSEYIARFSHKRRQRFRREVKEIARRGYVVKPIDLSVYGPSAARLIAANQIRYGFEQSVDAVAEATEDLLASIGERCYPIGCFDGSRLIAVAVSARSSDGSSLGVGFYGADYASVPRDSVYPFMTIYQPVQYAISQNIDRVVLGPESYLAKCRRGARPERREISWLTSQGPTHGALSRWLELVDRRNRDYFDGLEVRWGGSWMA